MVPSSSSSPSAVAASSGGGILRQRQRETNRTRPSPAHPLSSDPPLQPVSSSSSSSIRHIKKSSSQPPQQSTRWWYRAVVYYAPPSIFWLGSLMVGSVILLCLLYGQPPQPGGVGRDERLPGRSIVTVFPAEISVQESLPKFFHSYAMVTEQNLPARHAVQHVARQRRMVSDAGVYYNQKIALTAWEHETFSQRIRNLNPRCGGTGWEDLYTRAVAEQVHTIARMKEDGSFHTSSTTTSTTFQSVSWLADTLLLSCLLTSGYADGWIYRTVQPMTSLTRGLQGVAAVRVDTTNTSTTAAAKRRIHSDLLWLPILSREQRRRQQEQRQQSNSVVTPSTTLPMKMPQYWLAQNPKELHDPKLLEEIVQKWEEFLYEVIAQEQAVDSSRWVLWNAACQPTERKALAATQKLVATTCREEENENSTTGYEPADDEECCSFYDPSITP